jgi:hypothetical protein
MPSIQGVHDGRAATLAVAIVDAARYKEHEQTDVPVFQGAKPFKALEQFHPVWNLAWRIPFDP